MQLVRKERTSWRDEEISKRHRRWGWDCPAVDLDFVMLEYDKGKPSAIVEYKHESAAPQFPSHPSYQALIDLGNSADIPVLAVRYAGDFSWFRVTPLNDVAKLYLLKRAEFDEKGYVSFLYQIRGYDPPANLFDNWNLEL